MTVTFFTQGLRYRGAWSNATPYGVGDIVSQSGVSYACITAHTGHTPPNAAYWDTSLVSAPAGPQGAVGSSVSFQRPQVKLGVVGHSSPAEADFSAFNTLISPRNVDILLFMQAFDTEPLWYGSYQTWANDLAVTINTTISSSLHTLNYYVTSGNDSTGLNSGGIAGLAATAKAWGKPVIVRLFHEFNGNWNTYGYGKETAAQFVAGWRHVVDVFRANGAYNVLWCWGPNVWADAAEIDPTVNDGSGSSWYPGDNYVDIISLDGYMTTETVGVQTPDAIFMSNYRSLQAAYPSKPFAISEFGVAADARLVSIGGKSGWYNLFFDMVKNEMPNCLFVNEWHRVVGADDFTIDSSGADTTAKNTFINRVNSYPFVSTQASPGNRVVEIHTAPTMDGAAIAGQRGTVSDSAHVHPTDTSRAADASVVHLSGSEVITGAKTFNLPPNLATQAISANATLSAASAPVVLTDTTSAAFTLTLPATPVTGESFIIIDSTGQWNTHNLTIARNAKNIDGAAANLTFQNQWGKVTLYYDGTAWWTVTAGASNETPVIDGSAAAGTHLSYSRADHIHPTDTTRAALTSLVSQATGVGQPVLTSDPAFGAVCDAKTLIDAIITVGTATVAHASGTFTNADAGKLYVLNGGGAAINSAATLSGTLSTGAPTTALAVAALGAAFPGGALTITESGHTQQFFCAGALVGATSLVVTSQTPNFAYTSAATIKSWGAPLYTTILSVQSTTAITLATNALSTLSVTFPGEAVYGTDNATRLQNAVTAASGKQLFITSGPGEGYLTSAALNVSASTTIKGGGCHGMFGPASNLDAQNLPVLVPYLTGAVIIVAAAATDGIQFTGSGMTLNLDGFGIRFAGKWVNTGHGFNIVPPITASTFRDAGMESSAWKSLRVFGHDGNHYAYVIQNSVANMDDGLQSWGGGGIHHLQNSSLGQYGNHTSTQPMAFGCVGGSASAMLVENVAGAVFNMFRFHGHHLHYDGIRNTLSGAVLPSSAQWMYQTIGNVDKVTHIGIEGNGGFTGNTANFVLAGSGATFGHGSIMGNGGAVTNWGTGQNNTPTNVFTQNIGTLLLYTMVWDMLVSPITSADVIFNESAAVGMTSPFTMAQATVPANSTGATATLSGTVQVSDGARTTLPVNALPGAMVSGTWVTIYNGSISQQWKVNADAAAGATTLTVSSQTPNGTYVSTNGVYQAIRATLSSFMTPGWYYQAVATNAKFISRQSMGVAGS